MYSQGQLGNLGEPAVSLQRYRKVMGHRLNKGPGAEGALRRAPRRVSIKGNTNETEQVRVSGDEREAKEPEKGSRQS
jgi:hypothetical protein